MKKWLVVLVASVVALTLVAGGAAFAAYQGSVVTAPPERLPAPDVPSPARMGMRWAAGGYGKLHDYFLDALAEGLDITRDELDGQLAEGKTLLSIARDQGLTEEGIRDLWQQAREKALDAAVADGVITQDQADWLRQRGFGPAMGLPGRGRGCWDGKFPGWDDSWRGLMPFGGRNRPWGR